MASYPAYGNAPRSNPVYASPPMNMNHDHDGPHPYPPTTNQSDDEESDSDTAHMAAPKPLNAASSSTLAGGTADMRYITRTPSPTPSEAEELAKPFQFGLISTIRSGAKDWRKYLTRQYIWYWVIGIILLIITILVTVYHDQIVHWIQPAANKIHSLRFGWLIPVAILVVLSFPPLFGQEIIAILVGLVYGLGPGFAIVAAGTFIGECGNFFAFRHCCTSRGHKYEASSLRYACLARTVRDGGLVVALIARFSAIPGHFTTAVFSTCGMSFWTFAIAAILSTPKQLVNVYLGVIMEEEDNGGETHKDKVISDIVVVVTTVVTIAAMYYISRHMHDAIPKVIYDRRKARQADMLKGASAKPYGTNTEVGASTSTIGLAAASTSNLPLNTSYQNPSLYVPQPQRAPFRSSMEAPTHRPQGFASNSASPARSPARSPAMGQQYPMTERYGAPQGPPPRDPFADSSAAGRYAPPSGPPPNRPAAYSTPFDPPSGPPPAPAAFIPKLAPPPTSPNMNAGPPADAFTHSRDPSEELTNPFESSAYKANSASATSQPGGYPPGAGGQRL